MMAEKGSGADAPITIKKYANRRLYNTATSSYVTLDHLCQMVKDGVEFTVFDAKSGDDITRAVLTQIIVEEEAKGQNLLPIGFLRQLIGFYGDNMQQFLLPRYLEYMMEAFGQNQTDLQRYMDETFGSVFPLGQMEEMGKHNMALFEKAMKMYSPFGDAGEGKPSAPPGRRTEPAPTEADADTEARKLAELQRKLEELERRFGDWSDKKGD